MQRVNHKENVTTEATWVYRDEWIYRDDMVDNDLSITATRDGKWAVTNDNKGGLDGDGYAVGEFVSGPFDDLEVAKVAYLIAVSSGLGNLT